MSEVLQAKIDEINRRINEAQVHSDDRHAANYERRFDRLETAVDEIIKMVARDQLRIERLMSAVPSHAQHWIQEDPDEEELGEYCCKCGKDLSSQINLKSLTKEGKSICSQCYEDIITGKIS